MAKNKKYSNKYRGMNIAQISFCYIITFISIDLSRQVLQTNGKLTSNFSFLSHFLNYLQFFEIANSGAGFMQARWEEAFVLISMRSSFLPFVIIFINSYEINTTMYFKAA